MTKVTAEQLATARGCVLGLMLGDAIGAAPGGRLAAQERACSNAMKCDLPEPKEPCR
ncbi:hypothetical protein [Micromonospora sp. DPT]|uniref:hypothetical protein n=1 Tax=Micromonospora sp. DPT TaxID=3142975 RepID=UPI003207963A